MRSRVQLTAPFKMSPLFGPLSFSSIGIPVVMLPAVALRAPGPARPEVARGGLMSFGGCESPASMGERGELFWRALRTFSSSRRCMGTRWLSSWILSLMLSLRLRSTRLCDSRRLRRFISWDCSAGVPVDTPLFNLVGIDAPLRRSEICGLGWMP